MGSWGKLAGNIGGAGILIGIVAGGLAVAILGVGLLLLAITWFTNLVAG